MRAKVIAPLKMPLEVRGMERLVAEVAVVDKFLFLHLNVCVNKNLLMYICLWERFDKTQCLPVGENALRELRKRVVCLSVCLSEHFKKSTEGELSLCSQDTERELCDCENA
jgi:hypothetical protein